ncbi:MAG: hypothetical protein ABEJ91_03995 [Candidatus Nanohaloarchaea archaeon]
MTGKLEEARELFEQIETDDVGQKRYQMCKVLDLLLEEAYEAKGRELPGIDGRVSGLEGFQGYLYKLAQEFLTSSSTLEKERKLEKMLEHLE